MPKDTTGAEGEGGPTCPVCKSAGTTPRYRPFCSKRCADLDLARWLNESYAIPEREGDDEAAPDATVPSADPER
ncbi:MAG: DNA gyrase inhibitor YacG [Pseudomonadota bacterium]